MLSGQSPERSRGSRRGQESMFFLEMASFCYILLFGCRVLVVFLQIEQNSLLFNGIVWYYGVIREGNCILEPT